MRLQLKRSLGFMFESPQFPRSLLWGGFLLFFIPPIGWPIALGYRSLTLRRLLECGDVAPVRLPEEAGSCFVAGLGAVAVIFAYFVPFMLLYWLLAAPPAELADHSLEVAGFFALTLFLIPAFLPTLPVLYAVHFSWIHFSTTDIAVLTALLAATTFVLPAVFMQVSLEGTYWGARHPVRALRNILECPREYLEAWVLSAVLISLSFVVFPLFGWITFWAYLAIGMLFNNVLFHSRRDEVRARMERVARRFE